MIILEQSLRVIKALTHGVGTSVGLPFATNLAHLGTLSVLIKFIVGILFLLPSESAFSSPDWYEV